MNDYSLGQESGHWCIGHWQRARHAGVLVQRRRGKVWTIRENTGAGISNLGGRAVFVQEKNPSISSVGCGKERPPTAIWHLVGSFS